MKRLFIVTWIEVLLVVGLCIVLMNGCKETPSVDTEKRYATLTLTTATNLSTARLTAESKAELFSRNIISSLEKETAENSRLSCEASLALSRSQVVNARNNLSYTLVKSPVNGTAGMIPYRVGALVGPDITTPLTTVSDNSEMYAYFSMTESQVLSLSRRNGSLGRAWSRCPTSPCCSVTVRAMPIPGK